MSKLTKKSLNNLLQQCEIVNALRADCYSLSDELNHRVSGAIQAFMNENEPRIKALEKGIRENHDSLIALLDPEVERLEGYISERSERWRESEQGVKFEQWCDELSLFKEDIEQETHFVFELAVDVSHLQLDPMIFPSQP